MFGLTDDSVIFLCSRNQSCASQSTYVCRVQSSVRRLPKYSPPTPVPPRECGLPPAPRGGGGGTRSPGSEGVGGQYFGRRQTLDCLLQYNRSTLCIFSSNVWCKKNCFKNNTLGAATKRGPLVLHCFSI
jgi:hypothetical protein